VQTNADMCAGASPSKFAQNGVPYLFSALKNDWSFRPTGAVKVDSGSTLDLSPIPAANVSIGALEVDFATKGGTIKNAVLAETGSVDIKGATKASIDKLTDLGLTFDDASTGLDNVKNWTVKFDGEADAEYYLRMKDGSLHVAKRRGAIIIFK